MTQTAILVEQNWNAVPGGTARSTNSLITALGVHTTTDVVGVSGAHRSDPVLGLPDGLVHRQVPIPGKILTECWGRFQRPSLDRWIEADVVHAPAYVVPPTSGPLVVTVHDLAFLRHPEWFTGRGVSFFNRFLETLRGSDAAVIVPSDFTADDCVSAGIDSNRITTIPWGVDQNSVHTSEREDVRRRYQLPETFVLYVGTLEPRKNLDTLALAMATLGRDDAPLVVAGPDGWGDVSVPGGIMLGELSSADVAALMGAATILAYPSHFEGFGLPVLEAMAQSTPVITTRGTAPAEIAADGGLAVDTHDPKPLASAIASLLEDPVAASEMGAIGRRRADDFTWSKTALLTSAVYESVT